MGAILGGTAGGIVFQSPFYRVFECNLPIVTFYLQYLKKLSVPFLSGL